MTNCDDIPELMVLGAPEAELERHVLGDIWNGTVVESGVRGPLPGGTEDVGLFAPDVWFTDFEVSEASLSSSSLLFLAMGHSLVPCSLSLLWK